jgi:hypothetical protein
MSRKSVELTFDPAPPGNRVRLTAMLLVAIVIVMSAVDAWIVIVPAGAGTPAVWLVLPGTAILWAVLFLVWRFSVIRAYQVIGDELVVTRAFSSPRFPLTGLQTVHADRNAMSGALKLIGNGGLGAVSGRFRSRALGVFRAHVSNFDHAVVLRWPDQCLVVSPDRVQPFVEAVRKCARLDA